MTLFSKDLEVAQIAVEAVPGVAETEDFFTLGNTKIRLKGAGDPADLYNAEGDLYDYGASSGMEWGAGDYESGITCDESRFIYNSHFKHVEPSGATLAKTRLWEPAVNAAELYDTYTNERGQAGAVEVFTHMIFNTVKWLISKREKCTTTGDLWAKAISSIGTTLTADAERVASSVLSRMSFNIYTGATFGARTTLVDMARLEASHGPRMKDGALINNSLGPDGLVHIKIANSIKMTVPKSVSAADYAGPLTMQKKRDGEIVFITAVGLGPIIEAAVRREHTIAMALLLLNTPDNGEIDTDIDARVWDAVLGIDPVSNKAIQVKTVGTE